jgi:Family of unknown function (DUF7033)
MSWSAAVRIELEIATDFPRAAALYAMRQLAQRAGVSSELFNTWRVDHNDSGFTTVYLKPGTNKRIRFPQASPTFWKRVRAGAIRVSTANWMNPGPWLRVVPNFKIPFSSTERDQVGSLFSAVGSDCIECSVDLLASTLLTLSRFEETLPGPRDKHGRFSAFSSIAWLNKFLHRPIVDEYGVAFEQVVSHLLPGWRPGARRLRVKLGHDVDEIGRPFSLRSTIGHAVRRYSPGATIRDLFASVTKIDTIHEHYLRQVVQFSLERGLDSAVYWKASDPSPFDTGYDPSHPKLLSLISQLRERGLEVGIHPGYRTFESPERLSKEVRSLQLLFGDPHLGGRQDFLRWSPEMWVRWESLRLSYDASVGFADHIGFRAGTCVPYRPWLIAQQREADLVEIPLLAMDGTLAKYMKLEPEAALARLREIATTCRTFGGVFTLLWHQTSLFSPRWTEVYRTLLDDLAGAGRYDWRSSKNDIEWS